MVTESMDASLYLRPPHYYYAIPPLSVVLLGPHHPISWLSRPHADEPMPFVQQAREATQNQRNIQTSVLPLALHHEYLATSLALPQLPRPQSFGTHNLGALSSSLHPPSFAIAPNVNGNGFTETVTATKSKFVVELSRDQPECLDAWVLSPCILHQSPHPHGRSIACPVLSTRTNGSKIQKSVYVLPATGLLSPIHCRYPLTIWCKPTDSASKTHPEFRDFDLAPFRSRRRHSLHHHRSLAWSAYPRTVVAA